MSRIEALRTYLIPIIKELNSNIKQLNVDMLDENINSYSLDKIPSEMIVERWINGETLYKEIYSLRSRNAYSQDTINNLQNIGFFEDFQKKIYNNNKLKKLPNINGIESIKCLNPGTVKVANTKTAILDIMIQIEWRE